MFPGEPIGGEDAIIWHLEQADYYDWEATEADACEAVDVCAWLDARIKKHNARLKELEEQFPETAKAARAYLDAKYRQMTEEREAENLRTSTHQD